MMNVHQKVSVGIRKSEIVRHALRLGMGICLATFLSRSAFAQYGGGGMGTGTPGTPGYVPPKSGYGSGKAIGIGVGAAAGVGVVVMRAATTFEALLKAACIPNWLRPGIGGLVLAAIGCLYPQVLGSGHGTLDATLNGNVAIQILLVLLLAKALASAISATGSPVRRTIRKIVMLRIRSVTTL